MTIIKNIVASGCSQTADGIGGCPPSADSDGGCSFIDRGDGTHADPASWVGFISQYLQVNSLVNLAAESHGNIYITQVLIDFLSRCNYDPDQTLVLFNISEPLRFDVPCAKDHHDNSNYISYGDLLRYSWLKTGSQTHRNFVKNIGLDQIPLMSRVSLISLFCFLERKGYRYLFVTMNDYRDDVYIGDIVTENANRVDLSPGAGIVEFASAKKLLRDKIHPTVDGQMLIAKQILQEIHHRWPQF